MLVRFGNEPIVVMNTAHSPARQASSLMHECAHLILNHEPVEAGQVANGLLMVSGYRPQQEGEADWLAGALLLPRVALLAIIQGGMPPHDAARTYGVSEDMLRMRLNLYGGQFAGEAGGCPTSARHCVRRDTMSIVCALLASLPVHRRNKAAPLRS